LLKTHAQAITNPRPKTKAKNSGREILPLEAKKNPAIAVKTLLYTIPGLVRK